MSQSDGDVPTAPAVSRIHEEYLLNEIDKAFEQERLIIVFGAGISIGALKCSTARNKTGDEKTAMAESLKWKSLILSGFDYLEGGYENALDESEKCELQCYRDCLQSDQVKVGTMLRAAAFLKSKLVDINQLQKWLNRIFKKLYDDFIGEGPNEVLDSIRELYDSKKRIRIITTNYDDLINRRCKASSFVPGEGKKLHDFFSDPDSGKSILHVHGIWSEGESAVLDGIDYFKTTAHSYLQHALKACLGGQETLLFVGTGQGLEDPNFTSLLNWAGQEFRGTDKKHYVLIANAEGERLEMGPNQVLEPIKYGNYSRLPLWLSERAQKIGRNYGPYQTEFSLEGVPMSEKFVDRPSETAELERCLLLPHARQPRRRIFVLYGLGGIGKTQLALNFARRHQSSFSSIFWLDGSSEDQLKQSLAGCARKIPKGHISESSRNPILDSVESLDRVVGEVLEWLSRSENVYWLLIFDNVDQDIDQDNRAGAFNVGKYLPSDHGSALITTRLSRYSQLGSSKQLTKANEGLANDIFTQWYERELVMDEAGRELLSLLDGLPLALAQAASYLRETGLDIASYLRLYKQEWDRLIRSDESGMLLVDYPRSIGTTWTLSFKAIEGESKNTANLLRLWAFLDNKDLWYGLLQAVRADSNQWPEWLSEISCNEVSFFDSARLLLRYSMIETHGTMQGSYGVHPVVHRWTSYIQNTHQKKEFLRLAILVVGLSVPYSANRNYWMMQSRLLPHSERCLWWIEKAHAFGCTLDDTMTLRSIFMLGILYADQGKLSEAEGMCQRALTGIENVLGPDHTFTSDIANSLGNVYCDQDKLREAEEMYHRALAGHEKALGPGHTSTLATVNNLGRLYSNQGKLKEAEAMYTRALVGYEKALGPNHASVLLAVNNLGLLYRHQGKLEEAEQMYLRALPGYERERGPDHTSTLRVVINLGQICHDQGRLGEAEKMYQRALAGYEEAVGPDHPSTLLAVNNLGVLYRDQGRLAEAEKMYQRALAGYEKVLGPDHTSTLRTVNNFGPLYRDQGKLEEAEKMYKRALAGYEKVLGPEHTSTLDSVYNLGLLYNDQGQIGEAERMYQRALAGYEKVLGPEHTSTLDTMQNLGLLYNDQGQIGEAERMYRQALAGYEKVLGPEHTSTLDTMHNFGLLYHDQRKMGEAERMYRQALEGCEKTLGPDHTSTLLTVKNLGLLYRDQGKFGEAEKMFRRILIAYEKSLGPDHTSTLDAVNSLGILFARQGDLGDAEKMYQRVLAGYEKVLGPDHTSTLRTVHNFSLLYRDQGNLGKAEEMCQRALAGYERALGSDHTSTLLAAHSLGVLYAEQGRLEEAENMYQRALEGCEKTLGPDNSSTLMSVHSLGVLYADQGKPEEAERMYHRALSGREKALGPDHIYYLDTLYNLGLLYSDQGRQEEGERMCRQALAGYEKALGPSHHKLKRLVERS